MRKQGGFTLIELLVVIAILGVIAAVVALNVGNFFGRGTLAAANTEAHQVETAVTAYVTDTEGRCFDAAIGPEQNYPVGAPSDEGVHQYLSAANLQAVYMVSACKVVAATPIEDSMWGNVTFCSGRWQFDACDWGD